MVDAPDGVQLDALTPWFAANVDGAGDAPLHAELIAGGRSNLTYVIGDGQHDWVLRRPPLGHVVATAHDMTREHRVMSALAGSPVPVPRVFASCDDPSLIGAPFYVMERVDGRVLRESQARSICHRCAVVHPCREWARENREYGFWGGESEEERAAAGYRVDMPVGRVARYPKGQGKPVKPRESRVA